MNSMLYNWSTDFSGLQFGPLQRIAQWGRNNDNNKLENVSRVNKLTNTVSLSKIFMLQKFLYFGGLVLVFANHVVLSAEEKDTNNYNNIYNNHHNDDNNNNQ